jgi:glutathione synthase/RimK-type ligase-like ATP-grasp enzyme
VKLRIKASTKCRPTGKRLARAIGGKLLRNRGVSRYRDRPGDIIINWGCTDPALFGWKYATILNSPAAVNVAVDKLAAFKVLTEAGVNMPLFTDELERACRWYDKGKRVIQRNMLRASGGKGIVVCDPSGRVVADFNRPTAQGQMWTLYRKKVDEYRVHVMGGQVIDVQKKMRSRTDERWTGNNTIRNQENGWVYGRENVRAPQAVEEVAKQVVAILRLDFGAADIGWSGATAVASVYEVNTAPRLIRSTLDSYRRGMLRVIRERKD